VREALEEEEEEEREETAVAEEGSGPTEETEEEEEGTTWHTGVADEGASSEACFHADGPPFPPPPPGPPSIAEGGRPVACGVAVPPPPALPVLAGIVALVALPPLVFVVLPSSSSKSDGVGGGPIVNFGSTISFDTSNKSATFDRPNTINVTSTRIKRCAEAEEAGGGPVGAETEPPTALVMDVLAALPDDGDGDKVNPACGSNPPDDKTEEVIADIPKKCGIQDDEADASAATNAPFPATPPPPPPPDCAMYNRMKDSIA